jgi:hypothetical protein
MSRTAYRRPPVRRREPDPKRNARILRFFEILLVAAGGATGAWLIVSVISSMQR